MVHSKEYFFGNKTLSFSKPHIMGILNATPDSFFAESRVKDEIALIQKAADMIHAGATILDIGGYSSRPGAQDVTADEELQRVVPVVKLIRKEFPDIVLSVDTFRSEIAQQVLDLGTDIINDISGGEMDEKLMDVVGSFDAGYVLMHMRGTPQTMQEFTNYESIIHNLINFFHAKISDLKRAGVSKIIIDPGLGFSKTLDQNYEILKNLEEFSSLKLPLLLGVSRKSMIHKLLEVSPEEALNGSTVLHTYALLQGANILRVHDVKEANQVIKIVDQLL